MAALSGTIAAIRRSRRRRASGILNGLAVLGTSFLQARQQKLTNAQEAEKARRLEAMQVGRYKMEERRLRNSEEAAFRREAQRDADLEYRRLRDKAADENTKTDNENAAAMLKLAQRREDRLGTPSPDDPKGGGDPDEGRSYKERMVNDFIASLSEDSEYEWDAPIRELWNRAEEKGGRTKESLWKRYKGIPKLLASYGVEDYIVNNLRVREALKRRIQGLPVSDGTEYTGGTVGEALKKERGIALDELDLELKALGVSLE
jgi:hypothetical protein